MSNSIGSVRVTLSAPGPGGSTIAAAAASLPAFAALSVGVVDVPDTTASATAFAVPFGSIAVGASAILVHNKMGQDAILKINGSLALTNLPDDGWFMLSMAGLPAATKLTAVSLTTTATVDGSTTARSVEFYVLGDPV